MKKLFFSFALALATLAGCDFFVDPGAYNDKVIGIHEKAVNAYNDYADFSSDKSIDPTKENVTAIEEMYNTTLQLAKDTRKELEAVENLKDDSALKDATIADVDEMISLLEEEEKQLLDLWKKMSETDGDLSQEDIDKESALIDTINERNSAAYDKMNAAQEAFAAKYGYELEAETFQP